MKKIYFNDTDEFLRWNEGDENFVTAVYDKDDFVCDVLQKDVLYLQEIGFLNNGAEIVPAISLKQREMFKESWGVKVIVLGEQKNLYDDICRVLTWYEHPEEYPFGDELFNEHIADEMYRLLAKVQNELF